MRSSLLKWDKPTLVKTPGLEPHITALGLQVDDGRTTQQRWLQKSPEFAMMKLLADGAQRSTRLLRLPRR